MVTKTRARRRGRERPWRASLARDLVGRWGRDPDAMAFFGLALICLGVTGVALALPSSLPPIVLLLPMFLGSLWLGPRRLPWLTCLALVCYFMVLAAQPVESWRDAARAVIIVVIAALILVTSFRRSRLGVSGPRSEAMFDDLQRRIAKQGEVPHLPHEWQVETAVRSAGGTSFAGDFIVASRHPGRTVLEMAVVDVSGKGVAAGTRALLLSGAFGALMGALPASRFLSAANRYLLQQGWVEGFATAIHLHLDLLTGEFELRTAGHPPGLWLQGGSGRWHAVPSEGPVLGVIDDVDFECVRGMLRAGDVLLLYTDGLVETSERDISSGIDKLAGRAERILQTGFDGVGERLIDQVSEADDDRALVLLRRR